MEQVLDTASHELGGQVQALIEEYLQLKESGEISVPLIAAPDVGTRHSPLTTVKQRVVEQMAPLVESIARRYAGTRETGGCEAVEDLVSEGYVGLLTAIDQYQPGRGARFSTYATHRVHGQIRHYLRDRGSRRLIRAPSWLQELVGRLNREDAKIIAEHGRPATTAELAQRLNLHEEFVEDLRARGASPSVLSLTDRGGDEDEGGGVDLGKMRADHSVSWQLPVEDHIFLESLMGRLKELEQRVITLFFFEELSQSDIARALNISCNYVGYLLKNGLLKLRRLIEADELRDAQLRVIYAPRRIAGDRSVIDPITGLYNAGYFAGRLAEEIARACRYRRDLSLLVLRIVGVKAEESEEGAPVTRKREEPSHRARPRRRRAAEPSDADLVQQPLRDLGIALRECLRKADVPAWLEDQTFAVAMPHTGDGAVKAAQRIAELMSRVAEAPVVSGLARYPADGREPGELLQAAMARAAGAPGQCELTFRVAPTELSQPGTEEAGA
jgi:RNA polymerase sigma-B factor